jgi:hypothetical protein
VDAASAAGTAFRNDRRDFETPREDMRKSISTGPAYDAAENVEWRR